MAKGKSQATSDAVPITMQQFLSIKAALTSRTLPVSRSKAVAFNRAVFDLFCSCDSFTPDSAHLVAVSLKGKTPLVANFRPTSSDELKDSDVPTATVAVSKPASQADAEMTTCSSDVT